MAIRRYDLGRAWQCGKCGNILSTRFAAEQCCGGFKDEDGDEIRRYCR